MTRSIRVLVVDDSALMRKALKAMLLDAGFEVDTARNGVDCVDQVRRNPPDVVTLDVNMPEMDGMTCLATLMAEHPLPVVMVSSLTDASAALTFEALELGAVDYVAKPGGTVSLDIETVRRELVSKVRGAADARIRRAGGLSERLRRQRQEVEGLRSPAGAGAATRPTARTAPGLSRRTEQSVQQESAQRRSPRVSPYQYRDQRSGRVHHPQRSDRGRPGRGRSRAHRLRSHHPEDRQCHQHAGPQRQDRGFEGRRARAGIPGGRRRGA